MGDRRRVLGRRTIKASEKHELSVAFGFLLFALCSTHFAKDKRN